MLLQVGTGAVFGTIAVLSGLPTGFAFAVLIVPVVLVRIVFEDERRTEPIVGWFRRRRTSKSR